MLLESLWRVLAKVAEPTQILRTILQEATRQTGATRGALAEVSRKGRVVFRALHRIEEGQLDDRSACFSRTILGRVIRLRRGILIRSALEDPQLGQQDSVHELQLSSVLCVPIIVDESVVAVVHLEHEDPDHFDASHLKLLESLMTIAGPALEAMKAGQRVMEERDALRTSADRYREELIEHRELLARQWSFGRFVGRSAAVCELEATMQSVAGTDFPVLVQGEPGTGKSILARVLHHSGPRSRQPFVTVFCPSLERGMVETELFGHKRGAFTGAASDRIGKVQAAQRGTLFLDEIAELPPAIQPKLLRLLQEKTYERVGDPTERTADVRIIAATNRDLSAAVRDGRFRRDLYDRLNYAPISVPPLRERKSDLPLLLRYCLDHTPQGRWLELTPEVARLLFEAEFDWPANVRQVEQLAARLAMGCPKGSITAADLEPYLDRLMGDACPVEAGRSSDEPASLEGGLRAALRRDEKLRLQEALRRYPGLTRRELATKLKISPAVLYEKLRLHGIK
jgi:transcriptional regulator with GAF, ATPase, and Fis domain